MDALSRSLILRSVPWAVFTALLLFGIAGTLAWPGAWVLLLVMYGGGVVAGLWLGRRDPALLAERLAPLVQKDQKPWDRAFMVVFLAAWLGWFVLMALDARQGWSFVPAWLAALGAVAIVVSLALILRVLRENSFAAPVVKLQRERGQKVVDTGPYALVRHPMYAGTLPMLLGVPLLLGSWWGLAGAAALLLLLALRAVKEERMLTEELEGYADYARRVRWRLVPLVW